MAMSPSRLIAFYRGDAMDDRGRRIADIWRFDQVELEAIHDYIQWLFPLTERSAFNPDAPILDQSTIETFRTDEALRRNVERSLAVMLDFYGFRIDGDRIVRSATFAQRAANWVTPGNHNFLRLTRILRSLSLLGLEERAAGLLECLEELYASNEDVIGARTISFWRQAVSPK
jgi:hypothetical protein